MSKPAVALGLLAVMAGAWYWALAPSSPTAASHPPVARVPSVVTSTPVPAVRLGALAARTPVGSVTAHRRNPFGPPALDADAVASSVTTSPRPVSAAATPLEPAQPLWPRLELIGLAEAREQGSLVRIAIVSLPQGVLHARPGDLLAGVYRVERIGVDGVDVRLVPEDRVLRIALRR